MLGKDLLSGSQSTAPFGSARLKHLTTITGGHAGAKTVGTRSFEIAGLEGSFHCCSPVDPQN
jgi:hypothetical protein